MDAATLVREGRFRDALAALESQVRADPADPKLRVFLFQLLAVLGDWERASGQVRVASEMDGANLLLAHAYSAAIRCELMRQDVCAGRRAPLVFGEPAPWLADLVQAVSVLARGDAVGALALRDRAFEQAPAVGGTMTIGNGPAQAFSWLADADARFGPVLELFVDGKYYWVPCDRIQVIAIDAPTDLRDLVWMTGSARWATGGESAVMIPARYPLTDGEDEALLGGRRTEWNEPIAGYGVGRGQRMLTTDGGDHAIMEVRRIEFAPSPEDFRG